MIRTTVSEERVIEGISAPEVLAEHRARYAFAAKYVRNRRVLDLSCGSGYGSAMLHEAGAREVLGIDLDPEAIEIARRHYETPGLTFMEGDALDLPALEPFDVIVSFETIEHLDRPSRFLDGCNDLLCPGGMLFVSTPHRHRVTADGKPANPFHHQEWTTSEFQKLLQFHFDEVGMYGQLHKIKAHRLPLPRMLAKFIARLQGYRLKDANRIYPLPGPYIGGLWQNYPAYLVGVCRNRIGESRV